MSASERGLLLLFGMVSWIQVQQLTQIYTITDCYCLHFLHLDPNHQVFMLFVETQLLASTSYSQPINSLATRTTIDITAAINVGLNAGIVGSICQALVSIA
jgi:hypothetical protein